MMNARTHESIDPRLCGRPLSLAPGFAAVELATVPEMAVDGCGLVHGGFVFGAADYAAMLAVNDPNVVLGAAEVRFLAPLVAGDLLRAEARVEAEDGRKRTVRVRATCRGLEVFTGTFRCLVLDRHVFAGRGPA